MKMMYYGRPDNILLTIAISYIFNKRISFSPFFIVLDLSYFHFYRVNELIHKYIQRIIDESCDLYILCIEKITH